MKHKLLATAAFILVCTSGLSFASPVTFFGEDVNSLPDPATASLTNATNARNSFFGNLTGVGTETFEILFVDTLNTVISWSRDSNSLRQWRPCIGQ